MLASDITWATSNVSLLTIVKLAHSLDVKPVKLVELVR